MRKRIAGIFWMVTSTLSFAQLPSGTINGRVTDPQGATIAAAHVKVTSRTHDFSREGLTNADGIHVFPSLSPGVYDLHVDSAGFAARKAEGIVLEAGKTVIIDIRLEVMAAKSSVNVPVGQPTPEVQANFYSAVTTAAGFFGSGGPRAFQFAARLAF